MATIGASQRRGEKSALPDRSALLVISSVYDSRRRLPSAGGM